MSDPTNRKRRLVVVDEAWLLMSEPAGAEFLFRMAKSARKHWAGLTVVTQDAADLLGSPLGQAVVANAATQILLRQAPQSIDALAEAFGLSAGERAYLLGAAPRPGPAGRRRRPGGLQPRWPAPPKTTICRTGIEQSPRRRPRPLEQEPRIMTTPLDDRALTPCPPPRPVPPPDRAARPTT